MKFKLDGIARYIPILMIALIFGVLLGLQWKSPPARSTAVPGFDFDPPLEYKQIIVRGEQATLLVAVENIGLQTESDVKVKARLSAYDDDTPILEKTCRIDTIAPGQIKIARFKDIPRIPYRPVYRLQVWVLPAPGEVGMANNQRSYDLFVNMPR